MISSEIFKTGYKLNKLIKDMTSVELTNFRNSFDPDSMGFDGLEGVRENENN